MYCARTDFKEKNWRRTNKELEFMWDVGNNETVFTHILYDMYESPSFLWFAGYHNPVRPVVTDKESTRLYNIEYYLNDFRREVLNRQNAFNTTCSKSVLFVLGQDFGWETALYEFFNLDQIINYAKQDKVFSE